MQNAVAQRQLEDGVAVMRGRVFRHVRPDGIEERVVESASDYIGTLRDIFDLDVPEAETLWPSICARHEALFS